MRVVQRASGIAAVTLACLAFLAAGRTDAAVSIGCGSVVTQSVVLTTNLDCAGNGLLVRADNVTLDLGGHSILGSGSGSGVDISNVVGVVVEHGRIAHFGVGVDLFNNVSRRSAIGNTVRNMTLMQNGVGVVVDSDDHDVVTENVIIASGSRGIHVGLSHRGTISHNVILKSGADSVDGCSCGVFLGGHADGWLIEDNNISQSGGDGIFDSASSAKFIGNVTNNNGGSGIHLTDQQEFSAGYLFADNVANNNGTYGLWASPVIPGDGGGNVAHHNGLVDCVDVSCA